MTGALAQLVEQRTENPCVPGSIPGGTTIKNPNLCSGFLVLMIGSKFLKGYNASQVAFFCSHYFYGLKFSILEPTNL